jgi:uncharacterized protein involved in tolerance to divalent cations
MQGDSSAFNWSQDLEENKEIQVLFKRSNKFIKVESLKIYTGMLPKFIDFFFFL